MPGCCWLLLVGICYIFDEFDYLLFLPTKQAALSDRELLLKQIKSKLMKKSEVLFQKSTHEKGTAASFFSSCRVGRQKRLS